MTVAESHPSGPGLSTVVSPPAPEAVQAKRAGSTAFGEIKRLAIVAGVAVLVALLGSCAAGFGVSQAGGVGLVTALRDLGMIILALVSLAIALIWGGIYFGLAWLIGHFGGRVPMGLRWVNGKVAVVEGAIDRGAERFVVRPVAATAGRLTAGRTFLSHLGGGVDASTASVRRWRREVTTWPTLQHRRRWGTSRLPANLRSTPVSPAQDATVTPAREA